MIFTQPKELDPLIRPLENSKGAHIRLLNDLLPGAVFVVTIFTEVALMEGKGWPLPVVTLGVFVLLYLFSCSPWSRQARVLTLGEKNVRVSPHTYPVTPWANVVCFRFEPAGAGSECTKLTLFYKNPVLRGGKGFWSMIMPDRGSLDALIGELRRIRDIGMGAFAMESYNAPLPARRVYRAPRACNWLYVISGIIWMHGVPFMLAVMGKFGAGDVDGHDQVTLARWYVRWVKHHFRSDQEYRNFFLTSSACMAVLGTAGIIAAIVWEKKCARAHRVQLQKDEDIPLPPVTML